jgi:hypothetical protein
MEKIFKDMEKYGIVLTRTPNEEILDNALALFNTSVSKIKNAIKYLNIIEETGDVIVVDSEEYVCNKYVVPAGIYCIVDNKIYAIGNLITFSSKC